MNVPWIVILGMGLAAGFSAASSEPEWAGVSGQLKPGEVDTVLVSSYPPPIGDGWSVVSHPDDRSFAVSADGTFEAVWHVTTAAFHRVRLGEQTVELYLEPGDRATLKPAEHRDAGDPVLEPGGDQARWNQHLLQMQAAIAAARQSLLDNIEPIYSLAPGPFVQEISRRQLSVLAEHEAFAGKHGQLPSAVDRRVRTDVEAAFGTFRLLYPPIYLRFTGQPAEVSEDYYRGLLTGLEPTVEGLSSHHLVMFLDSYAGLESAGEHKFGDRNKPREKLLSRYQTIKAMTVDAGVKNYLFDQLFKTFETSYGPADWGVVLEAFARDYPDHALLKPVTARYREGMARRKQPDDIRVFRRVGGVDLEAHLFLPSTPAAGAGRAAFITFHGGGWAIGTPEWSYPTAQRMADRGLVAISFEYRLADVHGTDMHAAMADTREAIRWVRAHADELGVDPGRVVAHGFSAGAHLAGINAILAPEREDGALLQPDALILHSSTYDTTKSSFFIPMTDGQPQSASLTHQVKAGLVPTLLLHGKYDHLAPEAEFLGFVERMKALENNFEYHLFEVGHFFRNDAAREQVMELTDQFLVKHGFLSAAPPRGD